MMKIFLLTIFIVSNTFAAPVAMTDNVLFGFEKCKSLSVDLTKGLLIEAPSASFDMHCKKETAMDFVCDYFETGGNTKIHQEKFTGGSDLGAANLESKNGKKIKFLIGKKFASYESGPEQKVCIGIYIFEKDALKRKK